MLPLLFTIKTAHWTLTIHEDQLLLFILLSWWYTILTMIQVVALVLLHDLFKYERSYAFWDWYNRARSNFVFRILPKVKYNCNDND